MGFLRFLESIRTPAGNAFFLAVTYLGDEIAFMVAALILLWCVNKRQGYYVLLVGLFSTVACQILKFLFRIPRPWILEPGFSIVEAARAAAGDYSFPSGHSQTIAATLGALFLVRKEKWLRILCGILVVLVPFSRMYLGVHTPLDVCVGVGLGLAAMLLLYPLAGTDRAFDRHAKTAVIMAVDVGLLFVLFMAFWPFPGDLDREIWADGMKNACSLLGCVLGLAVFYPVDRKVDFQVQAPLPGQILKIVLGLALLLGIKSGLKALFLAVGFTSMAQHTVRYACMILFAGILWPKTFPFFARIGAKKPDAVQ